MKTNDRLLAVDSSSAGWREGMPEVPPQEALLMRLIRVASQGITATVDPMLRPTGLTESSFHTLVVVMGSGAQGATPTALCEQVGQNRANMTRILDLLASEKLVKVDADGRDARRKRIAITAAGRKLVRTYAARMAPIVAATFRDLGAQDKRTFERLLRTLIASMDEAERLVSRIT